MLPLTFHCSSEYFWQINKHQEHHSNRKKTVTFQLTNGIEKKMKYLTFGLFVLSVTGIHVTRIVPSWGPESTRTSIGGSGKPGGWIVSV